jgi:hypothetical protein
MLLIFLRTTILQHRKQRPFILRKKDLCCISRSGNKILLTDGVVGSLDTLAIRDDTSNTGDEGSSLGLDFVGLGDLVDLSDIFSEKIVSWNIMSSLYQVCDKPTAAT